MKGNKINGVRVIVCSGLFLISDVFANGSSVPVEASPAAAPKTETQSHALFELGAFYVTRDSFKFGDYTGLEKKGAHAIVNIHANKKDSYDSTTARYWNFEGTNLGLTSRKAYAEHGNQGSYKIWVGYDQLPKFQTDTAKTVFLGAGGDNLTLPSGWVASTTTTGLTALTSNLKELKVDHERRKYRLGFSKLFRTNWLLDAEYHREVKDGTKIAGAPIGYSGGNPRTVLIPEPIHYITDQFMARLGYTTARIQVQASYHLSLFDDHNTSLTWENPYARVLGSGGEWAAAAAYPTGKGRISLPPDNQFHQLMLALGYDIGTHSRLTANFARGRMTQDETFLPYTVNSALTVTTPLPRSSLDGRIDTTLLTLKMTSRPVSKLQWTAQYRYDDRKNRSSRAQYLYIGGDSQNQSTVSSDRARTNLPYSFKQNQFKVEGMYRLPASVQLHGSYTHDNLYRTFAEAKRTRENSYRVELRRNEMDSFGGGLSTTIAKRNSSAYDGTVPYYASYSPEYIATIASDLRFANHPLLRKFSYANRLRKQLSAWVSYTPRDRLSLQFNTNLNKDDYSKSFFGLNDSDGFQSTVDATYMPIKRLTSHAFYTYELLRSKQSGRDFRGSPAATKRADSANATRDWAQTEHDRIHTLGAGMALTELKDRYDIGAEYLYSLSRGKIVAAIGSGLVAATSPFSTLVTRLHSIELYGKCKITKDLKAKLSYLYERFKSRDWAYDGLAANSLAGISTQASGILTGEQSPQYSVSVFGLSVSYDL